jgi:thiamine-phosphate pyrophosphorylase
MMEIVQIIDYDTMGADWLSIAVGCAPFADMLWLRIKNRPAELIYDEAKKLREALPEKKLILSEREEIAALLGFYGVQLGAATVREGIDESLAVGYSAHSREEIENNEAAYYMLSPLFHTQKDYEVKPLGVVDLSDIKRDVYALGGISCSNVCQLKNKGYKGVAGISFYREIQALKEAVSRL